MRRACMSDGLPARSRLMVDLESARCVSGHQSGTMFSTEYFYLDDISRPDDLAYSSWTLHPADSPASPATNPFDATPPSRPLAQLFSLHSPITALGQISPSQL